MRMCDGDEVNAIKPKFVALKWNNQNDIELCARHNEGRQFLCVLCLSNVAKVVSFLMDFGAFFF